MLGNLNLRISIMLYLNHIFDMFVKFGSFLTLNSSKINSKNCKKKALRIIFLSDLQEQSSPLFKEWKILKIKDIVEIQNCLFVHSFPKGKLPKSFESIFQKCNIIHANPTRFSSSDCLYMPRFQSVTYGLNCISNICIHSWND